MQFEKQDIEAFVERIIEDKAYSIVSQVVEDYIRRNEERMKEFSLLERIVRVEEELRALKEVQLSLIREMNARFEAMEKRFEAMEKANQQRFEAINKHLEAMEKRFTFLQWFIGIGFTFLAFLITILNFLH